MAGAAFAWRENDQWIDSTLIALVKFREPWSCVGLAAMLEPVTIAAFSQSSGASLIQESFRVPGRNDRELEKTGRAIRARLASKCLLGHNADLSPFRNRSFEGQWNESVRFQICFADRIPRFRSIIAQAQITPSL